MFTAKQQPNGNFIVYSANVKFAGIVKVADKGWRVVNQIPGKRSSRTLSATPEQAAQKYFGKKITFEYIGVTQSADARNTLIAKLSPRYLKLSAKMRWVIDAVTGQDYGSRGPMGQPPTHLNVTSDGFVTTGGAGSEGAMFIGGFESFHNNLVGVLDTIESTEDERKAFWALYLLNVTDWRK